MWRPSSRPTRRNSVGEGEGGGDSGRDPRARRPTEGRCFFLRADGDRPRPRGPEPSLVRSERGVFMPSAGAGSVGRAAPNNPTDREPPPLGGARRARARWRVTALFAVVLLAALAAVVVGLLVG